MAALSDALDVLSAMLMPAVMVSACGSLILTTSTRLSRSIDRTRSVAEWLHGTNTSQPPAVTSPEHAHLTRQLHIAARRAKLLQDAMTGLYLTLLVFVAAIVVIGLLKVLDVSLNWLPTALAVLGALGLLYTCLLLVRESRTALEDVHREMDYLTNR